MGFGTISRGRSEERPSKTADGGFSLAEIYAAHRDELRLFVYGKVGAGPPDPDDIVQQAFANYAAQDDRRSIVQPIAFLVRTARNLISDHFRRSATRLNVNVDEAGLDAALETRDELSPEIVVLGRERFSCVMQVLRRLPERQRRFLLLNRIEGLSYTAIARANRVSVSTVRRDVEAGVAACQTALAEMMNEDDV